MEAFLGKIVPKRGGTLRLRVLKYIKDNPLCTCDMVGHGLRIRTRTASARIAELQDLGLVIATPSRKTGRLLNHYMSLDDPQQVESAKEMRLRVKFAQWLIRGKSKFEAFMSPDLKQSINEELGNAENVIF